MNFLNLTKNYAPVFLLPLILVACMKSSVSDEPIIDRKIVHQKHDDKLVSDISDGNIVPLPAPTFLKINDSCQVSFLKVPSRRNSGWNWSLTTDLSSVEYSGEANNCSNYDSIPVEKLLDFLEMHLQNSKIEGRGSVSRLAIDLHLVESLKNNAIEGVFNLARGNPNRKIFYNEVDTEFLRPHFQDVLEKSDFVKDVCDLFTRYDTKCVGKPSQALIFQGDYGQFKDLLVNENAGLASWSQIYFSLKNSE